MAKHTLKHTHTWTHIAFTFTDSCLLKHARIPWEDGPDVYNEPAELVLMDGGYKIHLKGDFHETAVEFSSTPIQTATLHLKFVCCSYTENLCKF